MTNKIIKNSFINAALTAVYVGLVSLIMNNGERLFGQTDKFLGPVTFLLLFVTSAAITAGLVLGKPALWYLDGQKKEAVKLFAATVGWLALFVVVILLSVSIAAL